AGRGEARLPRFPDLRQEHLTVVAIHRGTGRPSGERRRNILPLPPAGVGRIIRVATIRTEPDEEEDANMPVDTQQLMDEAEKLGQLVAQHPAVERYKHAQRAVSEDADASRL